MNVINEKIFVTPIKGLLVRDENGQRIAENGQFVENSSYYRRRIKEGDLALQAAPQKSKTKTAKGA